MVRERPDQTRPDQTRPDHPLGLPQALLCRLLWPKFQATPTTKGWLEKKRACYNRAGALWGLFDALQFNPVCAKVSVHKSARHGRVTHSFSASKKYVTTKAQHLNTCNDEAKQMRVLSSPVVIPVYSLDVSVSVCLCLFLFFSVCLCLSLSVSVCFCLSLGFCVFLCVSLCFYVFRCDSVCFCVSLHVSMYFCVSISAIYILYVCNAVHDACFFGIHMALSLHPHCRYERSCCVSTTEVVSTHDAFLRMMRKTG